MPFIKSEDTNRLKDKKYTLMHRQMLKEEFTNGSYDNQTY